MFRELDRDESAYPQVGVTGRYTYQVAAAVDEASQIYSDTVAAMILDGVIQ